ncbi:hypothetical protein LSG31_12665 [Fodinisporobacter ferrooxydans]|uniref:Uncharacterized protein n=1 Tax=Fodinisporobacter ferrooxydans TaxID=2901836 RepID=A0ABY4CE53_9BACL|nr:hypothetical protein LSG31_12665 [Alicyclobacillaceae bacterium MYW30-H2]
MKHWVKVTAIVGPLLVASSVYAFAASGSNGVSFTLHSVSNSGTTNQATTQQGTTAPSTSSVTTQANASTSTGGSATTGSVSNPFLTNTQSQTQTQSPTQQQTQSQSQTVSANPAGANTMAQSAANMESDDAKTYAPNKAAYIHGKVWNKGKGHYKVDKKETEQEHDKKDSEGNDD